MQSPTKETPEEICPDGSVTQRFCLAIL
jgi:hypothetical protein